MLDVKQVANYIISKNSPEEGDVSNLKLQKLLYYCQGFHLAITGTPLFSAIIEHWDHGPVVPESYHEYKQYGKSILPAVIDFDPSVIPNESRSIIDEVLKVYGQFAPWKLRDMTHNEPPWSNTSDRDEITHDMLIKFFKTRIKAN